MAHDDPEGWEFYNQTVTYAAGDPDIFILSNLNNVGSVEVNAFQVHSSAVLQKSITRGIRADSHRGALEGAADGCRAGRRHRDADRRRRDGLARRLCRPSAPRRAGRSWTIPTGARQRGLRGKELVRRRFLTPRLLRDWLALFNRLAGNDTGETELVVAQTA